MLETIAIISVLLFSVILHECAHGFVALRFGDPTAKEQGRLTLNPLKDQLVTSSFPLGVLNLLAHRRNLPIKSYVTGNFVASKLDLTKGTNIYDQCDHVFGVTPPYWDKNQKHSILVAWFMLP